MLLNSTLRNVPTESLEQLFAYLREEEDGIPDHRRILAVWKVKGPEGLASWEREAWRTEPATKEKPTSKTWITYQQEKWLKKENPFMCEENGEWLAGSNFWEALEKHTGEITPLPRGQFGEVLV